MSLASCIDAAKRIANEVPIDLVLLDLNLGFSRDDGYEVMRTIRSSEALVDTPVIILSGQDEVNNRERAIQAGARDYVQKPVDAVLLAETIEDTIKEAELLRV